MDWENHLEKIRSKKIEKTVKIKVRLPHMNKKTTSEKANFCSNTTLKLERKKITPQNHSLSRSISCFGATKINSKLTSKIMKMCEKILKNIAGRIPETTRSGNPFKSHPTTHQTKRASTNL